MNTSSTFLFDIDAVPRVTYYISDLRIYSDLQHLLSSKRDLIDESGPVPVFIPKMDNDDEIFSALERRVNELLSVNKP